MIYIRKIFKQDLRDGKQIAFPKEASNVFFNFNYQNNDPERFISFTYKDVTSKFNNYIINTRLYSSSSESRIDSNLKRFLIDKLEADIDDIIIFKKNNDDKYDFQFLNKNSESYLIVSSLLGNSNHQVVISDQEMDIEDSVLKNIILKTFKYLLSNYSFDKFKDLSSEKEASLSEKRINVLTFPKYFKTDAIISFFDKEQNKDELSSGGNLRYFEENLEIEIFPFSYLINQWYDNDVNNTSLKNFNRFISDISEGSLKIIKDSDIYKLVENLSKNNIKSSANLAINKIYFGPPGTGKSHEIKEYLNEKNVDAKNYARVTFHPDYDYHSFVGGYKPKNEGGNIKYEFVPQVFTNLYVKAWENAKNEEHYYLVIEEINRGNCAEIFGDIFQLLDRNPEYNIEPSTELRAYLEEYEKSNNVKLLFDGKLQMPNNLSILASMNTSDQSLYPMDSAFKRRWDWHYVPIDLKCTESNFTIKIDDVHQYSWLEFLAKVNDKIYSVTKSEDKQIGNWFINASKSKNIISKEIFINKVLFYLWNDVFKDEVFNPDNIFIERNTDGTKIRDISFNNFYNKDEQDRLLIHLFSDILNVPIVKSEDKEASEYNQVDQVVNEAAEATEEYKESEE